MKLFLERLEELLSCFTRIDFYAVDAGAVSILSEVRKLTVNMGIHGDWYVDGWASNHNLPNMRSYKELKIRLNEKKLSQDSTYAVAMGQQVNFQKATSMLKNCRDNNIPVYFFSDHWKDISDIFNQPDGSWLIPEKLFLPDEIAYDLFCECMQENSCPQSLYIDNLEIIPHLGVASSLADIAAISGDSISKIRRNMADGFECVILLALDPTEHSDPDSPGYDWRDVVTAAIVYRDKYYSDAYIWIKPHPRQDFNIVKEYCSNITSAIGVVNGSVEKYIAAADEVWGMTSVVLVVAQRANLPIRSFQPDRNGYGIRDSNPYIEPYVITSS